jgi:hypothetical protein
MKIEATMDSKDDPVPSQKMTQCRVKRWPSAESKDDLVPSQNQGVSGWTQVPRVPTKVSFKGGSHLGNAKPILLSSLSNLGEDISFKGGSL